MLGSGVPLFHTQSYSVSTMNNDFYANINDVAKAKGLTSNRALRLVGMENMEKNINF